MFDLRPSSENILIIDFGSQYTQLIARRVREINVYSEIIPWNKFSSLPEGCKGVILSGSPHSVREENSPKFILLNAPRRRVDQSYQKMHKSRGCLDI